MGILSELMEGAAGSLGIEPNGHQIVEYDADAGELTKSATWPLLNKLTDGQQNAPHVYDYKSLAEAYAAIVWLYVAGWIISHSASGRRLMLMKGEGKEAEEVKDRNWKNLMADPNEWDTWSMVVELISLSLETVGNAYLEKAGMVGGLPTKVYPLEPHFMYIKKHPTKKIAGYTFDAGVGEKPYTYEPDQIAHFKYANPNDCYYGLGTGAPLQATMITELYREAYVRSHFENEARPDIILTQDMDIAKGLAPPKRIALRRFAREWRTRFGGPKKNRLPALMPPGVDVRLLTEARQDMEFQAMEKSLRERILAAAGVPPVMAGIFEFANYANSREQLNIFWTVTMPPKLNRIAEVITKFILRPYNPDLWCQFEVTNIPSLEEGPKEKTERLAKLLDRGAITIGQYAEANGFPMEDNDPIKGKRIMSTQYVPTDDFFFAEPEPVAETGTEPEPSGATDEANEETPGTGAGGDNETPEPNTDEE